jgi:hypothetical protein
LGTINVVLGLGGLAEGVTFLSSMGWVGYKVDAGDGWKMVERGRRIAQESVK